MTSCSLIHVQATLRKITYVIFDTERSCHHMSLARTVSSGCVGQQVYPSSWAEVAKWIRNLASDLEIVSLNPDCYRRVLEQDTLP